MNAMQIDTVPGQRPSPIIEIEGLTKHYGRAAALRGLTMRVERGSIFGFVGPNGAGKTTTMRIIATLISADDGKCIVDDHDVRREPAEVRATIGYMPDFFGVYDDLTVGEYLRFYAASHLVPPRRCPGIVADLLELVDLDDKRDHYVESLSRGMKQRLGLARCLVHDPQVLVLDEPAAGMDPRARLEMRDILKELQSLGKTVLVSSHILPELAEMCSHIGIVQGGLLVRQGPVEHILQGVRPGRTIALRSFSDRSRLVQLLESRPDIADVAPGEGMEGANSNQSEPLSLTFRTFADDPGLRDIVQVIVAAGHGLVTFAVIHDNLEDVFMKLTGTPEA